MCTSHLKYGVYILVDNSTDAVVQRGKVLGDLPRHQHRQHHTDYTTHTARFRVDLAPRKFAAQVYGTYICKYLRQLFIQPLLVLRNLGVKPVQQRRCLQHDEHKQCLHPMLLLNTSHRPALTALSLSIEGAAHACSI